MNQKIKELMERMVIKMLEEELSNSESIISSQDGKTTISMKQNNMVSLLLYLQLTNEDNKNPFHTSSEEVARLTDSNEKKVTTVTNDFHEADKIIEKITVLERKNKQFRKEITELLQERVDG
ncbi:hypothetical protein GGQ92_002521 [Gracilibacillus halotolerans]|uniref:Uncharacterized protein n=1 Tax=Gracilibacillus halotolerans TaxID=74386 RepID=A0A841RPA9_9BACI|nr:hypothetical protein [Gracilibacillus halotolerans]MBB6513707.1 hypothetical protein [Gracilibacillus halotolerans]